MILHSIDTPADRQGPQPASNSHQLSEEIRAFIVDTVTATGGHLGLQPGRRRAHPGPPPGLRLPRDVILWDTGHQAYVHKLVTGRQDGFATLRQAGGHVGVPVTAPSPPTTGSRTATPRPLSATRTASPAAFERRGEDDRRVVAVLGDGSLTGGMAYEALNNLGHAGTPCRHRAQRQRAVLRPDGLAALAGLTHSA